MGAAVAGAARATQVVGATPVALFLREHGAIWAALKGGDDATDNGSRRRRTAARATIGRRVLQTLRTRGASFIHELVSASGLDDGRVRAALGELVSAGLVASDGFGGLRALVRTAAGRPDPRTAALRSPAAGRS